MELFQCAKLYISGPSDPLMSTSPTKSPHVDERPSASDVVQASPKSRRGKRLPKEGEDTAMTGVNGPQVTAFAMEWMAEQLEIDRAKAQEVQLSGKVAEEMAELRKLERDKVGLRRLRAKLDGRSAGTGGRESDTSTAGDGLFSFIAQGGTATEWCKQAGISMTAIYRRIRTDKAWAASYAMAQKDRTDSMAEQMLEIADSPPADAIQVRAAELRIKTRQWLMARMQPEKWADRVQVDTAGQVTFNLGIAPRAPVQLPTAPILDADCDGKPLISNDI